MSNRQSDIRFLCPVKTCCRALKSKAAWTSHLRSIHPLVKVELQDATIVPASCIPVFPTQNNRHRIQVSPPTSPADGRGSEYANNDFEMEDLDPPLADVMEEYLSMSNWPLLSCDNGLPNFEGSTSSPPPQSYPFDPESDIEYHPHINGKSPPRKLHFLLIFESQ